VNLIGLIVDSKESLNESRESCNMNTRQLNTGFLLILDSSDYQILNSQVFKTKGHPLITDLKSFGLRVELGESQPWFAINKPQ
jgi:hypothetical protein